MTDPGQLPARGPSTWLSVLMILIGIILLLPGVCAAYFVVAFNMESPSIDTGFIQLWLACFAVSAGGIALIWLAVRRLRS